VNSRWVRVHIESFEKEVRRAAEFRAVKIEGTNENAKFLYSTFIEVMGCIEFTFCLYLTLY
jgi:hypothetical protein